MKNTYLKKMLSGLSIACLVAGTIALTMVVSGCSKEDTSAPEYGEEAKEDTPVYEVIPYRVNDPGYGKKERTLPEPVERKLRE